MIKLDSKALGDVVEVTGDPGDVAIFYCVWQQHAWKDVFSHLPTKADDGLIGQIAGISKAITNGEPILLAASEGPFKKAIEHAVSFCSQFMAIQKD